MKRLLTLAVLLMSMSSVAMAQQALGSRANVKSPEIHPDNSVTFRLKAPEAKKVVVTGDFTTTSGEDIRNVEMKLNADNIWEASVPALRSELYSYNFLVDGVKICDPSNVYINRDVAATMNIFIINGDRGDIYKVNDVPHGTVRRTWYNSPTLGFDRRVTIYTPAGYEAGKEKYPVLYLLHGAGGDEEAWITLGRTAQILDNLIAQGKCKPMIVVMTNGNAGQQAAPGESGIGMTQPAMGGGGARPKASFEQSFGDVIKYVEDTYRVIAKKEARAVAGLSMGGGHSFNISRTYPNTFDYVGLFSAAARIGDNVEIQNSLKAQRDNGFKLYWIACGNTDFLCKLKLSKTFCFA